MEEIGLFPLGMVLLPTERVPLHIFEPRYLELIGECVEQDREFGLVYADDDGIQAVGTRAKVIDVVRLPDGRLSIVVEGRERFRLVELTSGRSFHTGRVEKLGDVQDPASPAVVARALELFREVIEKTGSEVAAPEQGHPELSFALAGCFELTPAVKQDLLREPRRASGWRWSARSSSGPARRQSDSRRSTTGRRETAASTLSAGRCDPAAPVGRAPTQGRRRAAGTMGM